MNRQEEFFDGPSSTLTTLQIREKLADVATEAGITGDKLVSFKDLLTIKGSGNGGIAVTNDLKYTSKFRNCFRVPSHKFNPFQSNLPGKMASMSLPLFFGMALSPMKSQVVGLRKSGRYSSRTRSLSEVAVW